MERELSSQNEHYLAELVASGVFPSREAALNAAVEALKLQGSDIPYVPDEHLEAVEAAIKSIRRDGTFPVDDEHWRRLDRLVDAISG